MLGYVIGGSMKKSVVTLMVLIGMLTVACNKLKITVSPEIDVAGKGNYNVNDIAVVSGNRGPISIKGENTSAMEYVYVTGSYKDAEGTTRCLIAKYAEDGKPLWFRLYPESDTGGTRSKVSYGLSLLVTTRGGLNEEAIYVLAGEGAGNDQKQLKLLRYDSLGNRSSEMIIVQSNNDVVGSLYADNAGNLYCAGYMLNKEWITEMFLYKRSPSGDPIWSSSYRYPELRCGYVNFQVRYPDQLVCAGVAEDKNEIFYIAFDSLGNALDPVVCQSLKHGNALADVITDERGCVYLVADGACGFSTVAYDGVNTMRWRAAFNDSAGDHYVAHAVAIDDSGCVYVLGSRKDQQDSNRLVLVKYDTTGAEVWRRTDFLIPGAPVGRWFIAPDHIHNRFEYRPAFDMDIIGGTKNGVFIARYNTVGFKKAFAQYHVKGYTSFIGAVDGKWIAADNAGKEITDIRKARLLKYEEFQILGINRWD
jgi:hypothetical protein